MEEVKARLLGMTGYLRKLGSFLISPQIRRPSSANFKDSSGHALCVEKARKLKAPWGEEQDRALAALLLALTSPPILAMPNGDTSFQLHTDASEPGAGVVVLTQTHEGPERAVGYTIVIGSLEPTPRGHPRNGK